MSDRPIQYIPSDPKKRRYYIIPSNLQIGGGAIISSGTPLNNLQLMTGDDMLKMDGSYLIKMES